MIGFYGWIIYIAICILYNYIKIEKWKVKPRYFVSNQWRAFFGLVALILMTVDKGFDPANHFWFQMWKVSPEIGYILSSFGLFFDPGLNALRRKPVAYQGKDSGILDKLRKPLYYSLKTLCLVTLVYTLIVIL